MSTHNRWLNVHLLSSTALVGASVEAGYSFDLGGGFAVVPRGSLAYLSVTREGYTEAGLGDANMTVGDAEAQALRFGGEVALEYETDVSFGGTSRRFGSELRLGAQHESALDDRKVSITNPTFGNATIQGHDDDETQLTLGAGMSLEVNDSATLYMGYDGELGGETQAHTVNLGVRFSW